LEETKELRQLIEEQVNIPSPPVIAVQILETVQQEESSIQELARIIATDPALTGKMLKVANSSFYSLQSKVTSIDRSLSILGTDVMKNIALSFVITSNLRDNKQSSFNLDYFWRRSITSAVAAELLKSVLEYQNDDIFVTALLHDIGVLLLYTSKQEVYMDVLRERRSTQAQLADIEQREFGFDHQELSYLLVSDWGLPETIAVPIRYHHNSSNAPPEHQRSTEILKFADLFAAIYNEKETVEKVRQLHEEMIQQFSLESSTIEKLLDDVANTSIEILNTFEIDVGDIKPYSQILQEANAELGKINLSYELVVLELKEAKEKAERLTIEVQKANSQLKELVTRDGLTGLYNHLHFQETLEHEVERASRYGAPLSLIMLDIDFFKKINDTYGHPSGDLVLKNIGKVISQAVRSSDLVARYGGEEFAVILPETGLSGLKVFAERLRRSIEKATIQIGEKQLRVTVSAGGASYEPGGADMGKQMLIDAADKALYCSKHNGRNRVTVSESLVQTD
jgi:diguanylate cyclase (GGDEF)-like protein